MSDDNPNRRSRALHPLSQEQRKSQTSDVEALYQGETMSEVLVRCGHCDRFYRVPRCSLSSVIKRDGTLSAMSFGDLEMPILQAWKGHLMVCTRVSP